MEVDGYDCGRFGWLMVSAWVRLVVDDIGAVLPKFSEITLHLRIKKYIVILISTPNDCDLGSWESYYDQTDLI